MTTWKGRLQRRELLKRLSLDGGLVEYMDSNKCVEELLRQLEDERRNVRREKLAVARLQREVARSRSEGTMREKLMSELEDERGLRLRSEQRLQEVAQESELSRVQMLSLQQHFSRMEETVRSLLQNQAGLEHAAMDPVDLMKAYKDKLSEEVKKQQEALEKAEAPVPEVESRRDAEEDVDEDGSTAEGDGDKDTRLLIERLRALEVENSALAMENESQRGQYERCLDEVANQVVQALLTQKDLREECLKLRTRVFDLEQQNRTLSVLFQQRVRPTSDLLIQKLHSKIMGLSMGDLTMEPERSKSFLLPRSTDSPSHELQLNGKAGLPVGRCLGPLGVSVPLAAYPRSSCSSSELSISSACSDFSNSSYTWNEGKPSSLTWEKRGTLGSSTPSNICALTEEQPLTWRKECHILEGLKRLQRRQPKGSPPLVSKSGYKDCMNSNEGIYSLGLKCRGLGAPRTPSSAPAKGTGTGSGGGRKFAYDSDDADDESCRALPGGDCWTHTNRLTHSLSDSLCSWEGGVSGGDGVRHPQTAIFDSKELPEKLVPTAVGGYQYDGSPPSAPGLSPLASPTEPDRTLPHLSDTDDDGSERPERESRSPPEIRCEKQNFCRVNSADSRPRPLSLLWQQKVGQSEQPEESVLAIFDVDGKPIQLTSQCGSQAGGPVSHAPTVEHTNLLPQRGLMSQGNTKNYSVLESPKKVTEFLPLDRTSQTGEDVEERSGSSSEHSQTPSVPLPKLLKPALSRAQKVHSVPPLHSIYSPKANLSKIPGRGKVSPVKASKGLTVEAHPAPSGQELSPSSPPVKQSRFIKGPGASVSTGCSQSSKAAQASSRLTNRSDWAKTPSSNVQGSPVLSRKHIDIGEQPTRDAPQPAVRSPSPPPPPGRTTSLLIRPNYDSSTQGPKAGIQPPAASTVKGHPAISQAQPQYQSIALKGQNGADLDSGCSPEPTPQKQVDSSGLRQLKSPAALPQTPTRASPKRGPIKLFHSSSATGVTPDPQESVAKGSKNILQKGSSLQTTPGAKKLGLEQDGPVLQKTSGSLPATPLSQTPCTPEPKVQISQATSGHSCLSASSQNSTERAAKVTRIPMGFKALVKPTPTLNETTLVPLRQDNHPVTIVGEGTFSSGTVDPHSCPLTAASCSKSEGKPQTRSGSMDWGTSSVVDCEKDVVSERGDSASRLFKRSVSVTNKPHLKPALGMNGAKARSQSFSTNYMERPSIGPPDGPGRIRTQIITNTGERGNSLTRQTSLGDGSQIKPVAGPGETLHLSAFSRAGPTGVCSSPPTAPTKAVPKVGSKGDAIRAAPRAEAGIPTPRKEVRSLSLSDRFGLRNSRHPQPESPSSPTCSPSSPAEGTAIRLPMKSGPKPSQSKGSEAAEKLSSPAASTIEERVMMGIQENVQRGQVQDRAQAPEAKQKSGPSLANWFGFRKSKLPALGSKKVDGAKGKEEKKELKMGSMLGAGKQLKPDRKKEKKKNEPQLRDGREHVTPEDSEKLIPITDHCSIQVGQLTNQIQHPASCIGKDLFIKELLNRSAAKGDSHGAPLPSIPANAQGTSRNDCGMEGNSENQVDTAIPNTQRENLKPENEDDSVPETVCQDNMIGSSCQTRTLDSGIGTFPLPDSVARANGRHLMKSASAPDRPLETPPLDPPPTQLPRWKVPSRSETRVRPHSSVGASLSDPTMTGSKEPVPDPQSRLPKPTNPGVMNPKRRSQSISHTCPTETPGKHDNQTNKGKSRDHASSADRALRVCTYSGSSDSEEETGPDDDTSVTSHPSREAPPPNSKSSKPAGQEPMKRSSVGNQLSIMDYYQQEVYSQFEKEEHRAVLLYSSPGTEGSMGDTQSGANEQDGIIAVKKRVCLSGASLESLNKRNSSGGGGAGLR